MLDPGLGQPPPTRTSPGTAVRPQGMGMGRRQGLHQTLRRRPSRWQSAPGREQATVSGPDLRRPAGPDCCIQDPVRRVRASRCCLRRARL